MHGRDVRVLQEYLTMLGYATPDLGTFGPITKANVMAYQQSQGLNPSGVVNRTLARAMHKAVLTVDPPGPVGKVRINRDGTATAPPGAPEVVVEVIAAANQIIDKPYKYAGGHQTWNDSGYDCSGSVSFALHGGNLLASPEDSVQMETYGDPGPGRWISIYADAGHAFLVVGGRAFDTANYGGPNIPTGTGPRWRTDPLGNLADGGGYVVRHPPGF
jgi:peptidoglycan hydrolase-like protein with peptidoglycan-binding domain